jgi:hypothetical protein
MTTMAAQEDQGIAAQMAEWLGLEGDEISSFVEAAMKRKGHKPVLSWADNEEGGDKKKSTSILDTLTGGGDSGKKSSANWQYGGQK